VADAAELLDILSGYEPGDPWWAPPPERPFADEVATPPGRLRIAVTAEPAFEAPVDAECIAALDDVAALLDELGHDVAEATPSWNDRDLWDAFITLWQVSAVLWPVDPELMTPVNRELAEAAHTTSSAEFARSLDHLQTSSRRVVSFWRDVDVVVTPTLALPPVPIGWQHEGATSARGQLRRNGFFTPFTAIVNVTGQPAMSVPLHWSADGLPIGVHVIGPPAGEGILLRLAAQLEEARPWHDRRPKKETSGPL
jgi:amidase